MICGVPQGDPFLRQAMKAHRALYPCSELHLLCQSGCALPCLGCRDCDLPHLRRLPDGAPGAEKMVEIPLYDPFTILVDGKFKKKKRKWAVGITHPHSGASRRTSGVSDSLAEGGGWCSSTGRPVVNQGQVQTAVEQLAVSVGAKWFWCNREFASTAHTKFCVEDELPEYRIFTDTTYWLPIVQGYFEAPSVATLEGETESLRSLVAHLESLAARAKAVHIIHKRKEPIWGHLDEKQWPPDIVAKAGIRHCGAVALEPRIPLYADYFACTVKKEGPLYVALRLECIDHEAVCMQTYGQDLRAVIGTRWRSAHCMAYFDSNGTRLDRAMPVSEGTTGYVVCRECYLNRSQSCRVFNGPCCPRI